MNILCMRVHVMSKPSSKERSEKAKDIPRSKSVNEHTYFGDWSILPDAAVLQIYSFLKDRDRVRMSMVCKNWSYLLSTPVLWRCRFVHLRGFKSRRAADRTCNFLNKFGKHLKHLHLICGRTSFHSSNCIAKSLESIFLAMSKIRTLKLQSFSMENFDLQKKWRFNGVRFPYSVHGILIKSLCKILSRSNHLSTADFTDMRMPIIDGCRVLEALVKRNSKYTLKRLYMQDMFARNATPKYERRFCKVMEKFRNLTHIFINYNYLSDEIITIIGENAESTLEYIFITVHPRDSVVNAISTQSWTRFSTLCPTVYVGVSYSFEEEFDLESFRQVFVRSLPLSGIDFVQLDASEPDGTGRRYTVAAGLIHIAKVLGKRLEYFGIMVNNKEEIDGALLVLLTRCTMLREISINAKVSVSTISAICQMQIGRKTNLKAVSLSVHGLSAEEMKGLGEVKSELRRETESGNSDLEITINDNSDVEMDRSDEAMPS